MKAILIDSAARQIREVQLPSDSADQVAALIGCKWIQLVPWEDQTNNLFIDEEGNIDPDNLPPFWFRINGWPGFISGNGLILGQRGEDGCDTSYTLSQVLASVEFFTLDQMRRMKNSMIPPENPEKN